MRSMDNPTRRQLLKAGFTAMGLIALIDQSKPVQASHINTSTIEPILSMQDIANVYNVNNNLIIEHIPSGSQFVYDGEWQFDDNINMLNNSITNIANIFTDALEIDNLQDGASNHLLTADETGENIPYYVQKSVERTLGVSTSATQIWVMNTIANLSSEAGGGYLVVTGREQGNNAVFTDFLHVFRFQDPQVINSFSLNSPTGRTYSRNGGDINLAMVSDTYDVLAEGTYIETNNS